MPKDRTTQQIELIFRGLNSISASNAIPSIGTLSEMLNNAVDKANASGNNFFHINQLEVRNFATAAVEMWHRAIHSFLISASLTKASPLWASVAGYYSSHYSIRAFAHLLGYFLLYRKNKCSISLEIDRGSYLCNITAKDREHRFYWKKVKQNDFFANSSLFTSNEEFNNTSDSAHRNVANYYDHINQFPHFQILDNEYLKQRIKAISLMPVYDAPIPDVGKYPDIESVQLIAYYRLVNFRFFLDEIVLSNRFWSVQRNPAWCPDYLKFQLSNQEFITAYREILIGQ